MSVLAPALFFYEKTTADQLLQIPVGCINMACCYSRIFLRCQCTIPVFFQDTFQKYFLSFVQASISGSVKKALALTNFSRSLHLLSEAKGGDEIPCYDVLNLKAM